MSNKKRNNNQSNGTRLLKKISPKTDGQFEYMRAIVENDITICTGPAGSGKSLIAVSLAAEKFINREYDKIIITRPVVGCGKKSLGALPGDIDEKMAPYLAPVFQHFSTLIGEQLLKTYVGEGRIQISPLEFMRGSNFDNCFVILDEAQNADFDELVMFITRFSEGCKMVINGDPAQTDLHPGARGIDKVIKQCKNLHGFGIVELSTNDIVRHDIVRRFLIAMEPVISNREYRKECAE